MDEGRNIGKIFLKFMLIIVSSFIFQGLLLRLVVHPAKSSITVGEVFYPMLLFFITASVYFFISYYKPKFDLTILIIALILNFGFTAIIYLLTR
ncbi:MAG: hypothetical protein OZ913_06575 [Ignavibacteriaceae bacterium]|jgi:hypothetical protein|nr:MAG: hypothetical protein EDM69_06555 [Chlorobiota bacterium]KXK06323.1 MAG: hypothetical protein UZ04_CHB001000325 [Chlorobi bacterium OLB4]MBV6399164.1 hypothetical protein [Ignavibacteria bacterium]MCC6885389.1 hypothetical protein [Ignavibacteriales bacterium]MCE7953632.1 hypothetical protein [Chlorobi bacterium CHB7]MDL1887478.1 hypothetical protein [Ignavibacteria bacterium CHB1]MEB2329952.1 hypothetical protein [Ignavibacteriaceae bacterium]OQY78365.1 MAG: hypothetical protein B6D4